MPRRRRFRLRRAHRWFGLALLLPLFLLVATGILLNHTEGLGLDNRYAGSAWLAGFYQIRPPPPDAGFPVGERWISRARDTIFLDHRAIGETPEPLLGAAAAGGMLVVAAPGRLFLYTPQGRAVDAVELPARAAPATGFALVDGRPTVTTPAGAYALNAEMTAWLSDAPAPGETLAARPLPEPLRNAIAARLTATTLSWERVLLDLHSGRLFGRLGPWFVDLAALAVAVLATTGCLMWLRATRGRRRRRRRL